MFVILMEMEFFLIFVPSILTIILLSTIVYILSTPEGWKAVRYFEEPPEFIPTSHLCPQCKKTNLQRDLTILEPESKRDFRKVKVLCEQCKFQNEVRYGECNECILKPLWDANSGAALRNRCTHDVWVE